MPERSSQQQQKLIELLRHHGELNRIASYAARRKGLGVLDAEEVAQDAVMRFFQRSDRESIANPHAWVTRAAQNRAVDLIRRNAHRHTEPLDGQLEQSNLGITERNSEVAAMVLELANIAEEELSAGELAVFYGLVENDGYVREALDFVSEKTGRSIKSLRTQLVRARVKLRQVAAHLDEYADGEDGSHE